ncbi:uncharacterized protein BO95DRAFT_228805 [Aspergillus brunneoviolaceus CBS 621.78]|uniref:Uncharacterized protein n=1 Tax=Aspergillus brunneoviolaceus CBS 621.78 TaxID=1450534 RepID=A0ACD1G0B8_9EURO|nr:hypothetical protein BO95DRAFT_228805 [Aspergillus brunneoviolaceus CBS 621.78]RAH42647.1 hypothetical protein BO95DRAFT_228805 [Aspergillus brunneoviolaceus CBS 621.78]
MWLEHTSLFIAIALQLAQVPRMRRSNRARHWGSEAVGRGMRTQDRKLAAWRAMGGPFFAHRIRLESTWEKMETNSETKLYE